MRLTRKHENNSNQLKMFQNVFKKMYTENPTPCYLGAWLKCRSRCRHRRCHRRIGSAPWVLMAVAIGTTWTWAHRHGRTARPREPGMATAWQRHSATWPVPSIQRHSPGPASQAPRRSPTAGSSAKAAHSTTCWKNRNKNRSKNLSNIFKYIQVVQIGCHVFLGLLFRFF